MYGYIKLPVRMNAKLYAFLVQEIDIYGEKSNKRTKNE